MNGKNDDNDDDDDDRRRGPFEVGGASLFVCVHAMELEIHNGWIRRPACTNNEWLLQRAPDVRGQTVGVVFIEREREQRSVP